LSLKDTDWEVDKADNRVVEIVAVVENTGLRVRDIEGIRDGSYSSNFDADCKGNNVYPKLRMIAVEIGPGFVADD
jgi:hypothetical protein